MVSAHELQTADMLNKQDTDTTVRIVRLQVTDARACAVVWVEELRLQTDFCQSELFVG